MRVILAGIFGLFVVSPSTALPTFQPRYDLKCAGNLSGPDGANAEAHASAFTMTLHVDLDHKLFCHDSCATQEKISKVLSNNIIFRAVDEPWPNRLWVADTGQFSYTWVEAPARGAKSAIRSAQGFCTKVMTASAIDKEGLKEKGRTPKPPIGYELAAQRSGDLSEREITALIDIQNHRSVPGSMHRRLWLKGLARFDDDMWVLTDKGEAIISGDRR